MATVVKVQSSDGRPTKSALVSLWIDGVKNEEKYTDEDGEAYFDFGPGEGTVYCDHTEVRKGKLSAHVLITR